MSEITYSLFYDLPKLDQIAVNLFYGWGYNFYRKENQLRADDLMVRSRISMLLSFSRKVIDGAQSAYRKKFLPPPTRDNPLPDPDCVEHAQTIAELSNLIGQLEGRIRALPVPETDRMTQRYRQEAETLVTLREYDSHLVGRSEVLRQMLQGKDYDWVLANATDVKSGIEMMSQTVQDRQRILQ